VTCTTVLVCGGRKEEDAAGGRCTVVTATPGHKTGIPWPSRKRPMMLVSGTSTPAHPVNTAFWMSTRPWTQPALQPDFPLKSWTSQPLMWRSYAAWHSAGRFCSGGFWKFARAIGVDAPTTPVSAMAAIRRFVWRIESGIVRYFAWRLRDCGRSGSFAWT
jgi:hypothetical protein